VKYTTLPPIGTLTLPTLTWKPTSACSPRSAGAVIEDVWAHRWGGGSFDSVVAEFLQPANQASAHFVYAGETGNDAGRCAQMVPLAAKAWTEAAFNSEGVSIECADAIWLGHDPVGFARTARICGWLLQHQHLPALWVHDPHTHQRGITRHADGGADAGGHTACPTTDLELWQQFVSRTAAELLHGHYRTGWAR